MNEAPRVVFDTNILFSSIGWLGNPYHCVQAARHGQCLSVTCEPILAELAEKLQLKRCLDAAKTAEIADEIRAFSKVVPITGVLNVVAADPDDDPIVECAVVGQTHFIVSGDRHLLSLKKLQRHPDRQSRRLCEFNSQAAQCLSASASEVVRSSAIRASDSINHFGNVVGQQFINPAVEVRVVFISARFQFQGQTVIAPEKVVAAGFVHDANHSATNACGNIHPASRDLRIRAARLGRHQPGGPDGCRA